MTVAGGRSHRGGGVPYAVIGGNAVMAWMEQVDESAVRFTQDVDIVLRRAAGIEMFLDGPGAKARDAVHVIFAGERVNGRDFQRLGPRDG